MTAAVEDDHPVKACSYPGCGKPCAYLDHANGGGQGWRHIDPAHDGPDHIGYPMRRTTAADEAAMEVESYQAGVAAGRQEAAAAIRLEAQKYVGSQYRNFMMASRIAGRQP